MTQLPEWTVGQAGRIGFDVAVPLVQFGFVVALVMLGFALLREITR